MVASEFCLESTIFPMLEGRKPRRSRFAQLVLFLDFFAIGSEMVAQEDMAL